MVLVALAPLTAFAQLAPRHSFNVRGDVAMVGNALLTCATSGTGSANCASQRMSNSTGGNGNRVMEFINVDAAGLPSAVPANSSAATLSVPTGARIRSAGLYWGARAGNTDAARRTIQLRVPGGTYRSVTASAADLNTFNDQGDTNANRPYTAYADVTALVAASGNGTYYAGGLTAVTGNGGGLGNYGGWALIVLYEDDSKPFRRLMVFDGNAGYVSGGNAQSASVSGLLTPASGPFNAFMGALVWEGDGDITGDAFQLSGNGNVLNAGAVSDALSPANNFWNSGITRLGERFTNKTPDYANQFAVDLKLVDISNNAANAASARPRLANSATGATLTFTSTGDAYFPHALVFVTDLFVPDLVSSLDKTVRNLTHPTGPLRRGDILEYTISFQNSGQDGATRTTVRDPIPTHTAFVPGSLRVVSDEGRGISSGGNPAETDSAGDDVAEFDAAGNRVVFRVGAGADATNGGLLTPGQGATLRFQVKVSDTAPDTAQIINNAEVTHNGQTVEVPDDYEGRASATIGPVEVPAIAAVDFCPADGGIFGVVNGAGFRRFVPGASTDEAVGDLAISLPGNLNGLMVDAARNRLLFHTRANGSGGEVWAYDANNGGWYQTGAVIAADLPRAGMTREGIGYMVTAVSGRTARMYRLDPAGTFGYTPGAPTTLTYDVAPSDTGSGDIAFDQDGIGWLVAGSDLYRVDVDAGTATLQQRFTGAPNGAFYAGAAFGADGRLYVVVNATGNYYAMDLATGTMTLAGNSSLASGSDRGRDLASCSFPAIAPPQLQVDKVLGAVNGDVPGSSVAPGDVLEYEIRVRHVAGSQAATLFAGDVVEGVPANTTFLPAGSDFTCSAAVCSNTNAVNITAGGSVTLRFRVQVAATVPSTATAIRNEVAVQGNTPVDCAATGNDCEETTPLTLTPGLASTKVLSLVNGAAPSGTVAVGDVLTYTVTATNTGNMLLPLVVVADARIVPASITCTDLAPTAACVLTGVYTVTQTDVDTGLVRNTATITTPGTDGVCPVGNSNASCSPTLEIPADPALPALTIVKTASAPGTSAVGDTIAYSFLLTNTGNVTLNALAVVDGKLATPPVCPVTTLAPGATTTCTGTYTLVQADLDAGRVVNTAHAEGTPPATPGNPNPPRVPSPEDEETTDLTSAPALTIVKSAGLPSGNTVGSTIAYAFLVTNTGNVTLRDIAVVDARLATAPVCPVTTLVPGATTTCTGTYTLVQADLDAGRVVNTAHAEGTPPATPGNPNPPRVPSPEDEETTVLPAMPSLALVKTAGSPSGNAVGSTIPYSFLVTNTGNITLTSVAVVDDRLAVAPSCPLTTLAPGASTTCTGTYTLSQADLDAGRVRNVAHAEGMPPATPQNPSPPRVPSPEDEEITVLQAAPALRIVKTAGAPSGNAVGATIPYSFLVTNTGNITLTGVAVVDSKLATAPTCPVSTLAPGATTTCTGSYVLTQSDLDTGRVLNTAHAEGTPPATPDNPTPPRVPSPEDDETTELAQTPALTSVKQLAGNADEDASGTVTLGDTLTYAVTVTNTGNTTLASVTVSDARIVPSTITCSNLAPTLNCVLTGTYRVSQNDMDSGLVRNAAVVSTPGNPSLCLAGNTGALCNPTLDIPVDAPAPALSIVKSAATPTGNAVGSTIAYTFVVTNTGNVTLGGIAVVDAKLSVAPVCPLTTLAPGAATTCTGSYTLVQADLDAGRVVNAAHAEGTPPATPSNPNPPRVPSPEDEETTPLQAMPALTIVKTAGTPSGSTVGSTIAYSFLVTNTGNVTVTGVAVVDDKLAQAALCPTTTLAPGGTTTCTGTYTLVQADLDAGRVVNSAHAEGTPPATPGNPTPPRVPSPEDEEITDLPAAPSLSIVKTADAPSGTTVGSTIAYRFLVTNTGNVTLRDIAVVDAKLAAAPTCPTTTLAPGATTTCSGSYTLTQADVDAGRVVNSAHAEGTPPATPSNSNPPRVPSPEDEETTDLPSAPSLSIVKTAGTPSGATVGSTIAYTFVVTNTGNVTLSDIRVVDAQLAVAPVCPTTTLAPGAAVSCTGSYTLSQLDLDAGRVVNRAHAEGVPPATPGNPNPPRVPSPEDEAIVDLPAAPSLSIEKTAGPASGNAVGSTIAYTFLVTNTGNLTLTAVNVVDSRLATAPSCPVTVLAPGASTVCTGSYTLVQADLDAGEVVNTAHAEGTPPSTPGNPGSGRVTSPEDTVRTPVAQLPALESTKLLSRNADEDGSGTVSLNDTLTYTITATNAGNTTLKDVVVTDSRITPASVTCAALAPAASCVLTGTYQVSQADVVAGNVRNVATIATATPGLCEAGNDDPICSPSLDIPVLAWDIDAVDDRDRTPQNTPVTTPVLQNDLLDGRAVDPATVQVSEQVPPTNGSIVVNDDGTITYTPNPGFWGEDSYEYQICERANPTNCTTARVVIAIDPNRVEAIDDAGRTEPGVPLQLVVVGNDRSHGAPLDPHSVLLMTPPANGSVTCAAGSCSYTPAAGFAGTDTYVYRVCDTSYPTALCADATVTVDIEGTASLRLTKSTTSRDIKTGDLVRYSVTIENVGTVDLTGGSVLDTPPAGFTYVEGSLAASDARSTVVASGFNPIRFDGIDLKVGDQMTLVYLMRVGAGVQRGVQINRAQALDGTGQPASNVATAEVVLDADPLLDESLVFGTVFDDRDGDGWQDSAALTGVKVQGGFAAGDYVAGSTHVDNGDGAGLSPVADASAPLLRGLSLGRVSGRQSVADPAERHAVVIRQRLRTAAFTDDFVLESDQGIRVRMAADGSTRIETRGDAAKGLTAAAPVVERRSVVEGNEVVVDYIIRNEGIDERGIPGVRLASVEGLLIETDQFGRYHLTGVDGGAWTHGRNFILKVDPSTLPAGAGFTTANPLLRRVTPGVPVRFDFGVRMPEPIRADAQAVELELGEVLFAPDSAVVRPRYGAVLEKMAAQVETHGGGDVLIRGDGNQALGYQRAVAVRDALVARLPPAVAQRTSISVRGDLGDPASRSLTLQGADTLLGTVLFDTDKAEVKPEFGPLMEQVAAAVVQVKGRVIVTGHTDVRGSHAYNRQLGLRRAQAVQRAIAANLPPGTVQAVNVEYNDDPATPAEHGR